MQKVANYLDGSGIKVYVTRNSDTYPTNSSRAQSANAVWDNGFHSHEFRLGSGKRHRGAV